MQKRYTGSSDPVPQKADWKLNIVRSWFQQSGFSQKTCQKASSYLRTVGWMVKAGRPNDQGIVNVEILDGSQKIVDTFDVRCSSSS